MKPPSRSPSPGGRNRGKGKGKGKSTDDGKDYWERPTGEKVPKYCKSFRDTGKCTYEANNPGKQCSNRKYHLTQAQYDAKYKKLNNG